MTAPLLHGDVRRLLIRANNDVCTAVVADKVCTGGTQPALDPISHDSIAHGLRHNKTEPQGLGDISGQHSDQSSADRRLLSPAKHATKVVRGEEPVSPI
jgi:hypothetical protein